MLSFNMLLADSTSFGNEHQLGNKITIVNESCIMAMNSIDFDNQRR